MASNVSIRFNATANFSQVAAQITKLNAQLLAMQGILQRTSADKILPNRKKFQEAIMETGRFRQAQVMANSALGDYTKKLMQQKASFGESIKSRRMFNQVLREQYALQRAVAVGWSQDANGRVSADMIIPKDIPARVGNLRSSLSELGKYYRTAGKEGISFGQALNDTRMRMGLFSQVLMSGSKEMINWGKNTQWAGRQLMVGMGIPFAAFGVAAAAASYSVDKEMTRILKVYDYADAQFLKTEESLKSASLETAKFLANTYGQSSTESLKMMSELAATGKTGKALQEDTIALSRARFLGELDLQDALRMTTTLQTVYGQSGQDLVDTFAMINAVENQTILSTQDFAELLPRVGGLFKELGGDAGDVAVLGAAMKSAGIDAAEGGTALKSISFRAVAATAKGQETFLEATGKSIDSILAQTNGEIIPTLLAMAQAMEGLGQVEKIKVVKDVFGIYQGSKALGIIQQLMTESDQVKRAMDVTNAPRETWLATAEQEVDALQNSLSGKFKIALEAAKAELAEIGGPFLKVVTTILQGIAMLFRAFNDMDSGTKQAILFGLAIAAIVGPLVMIIGIFANFMGQIVRTAGLFGLLITRFKLYTAEGKVAELTARQQSLAWTNEAASAQALRIELAKLTAEMAKLTDVQARARGLPIPSMPPAPGRAGPVLDPDGVPINGSTYQGEDGRSRTIRSGRERISRPDEIQSDIDRAHSEALRENAQREEASQRRWAKISGYTTSIGVAASFMTMFATESGTAANNFANILLMTSLFAPLIISSLSALAGAGFFKKLIAQIAANGIIAKALAKMKIRVASIASSFSSWGPAAGKALGVFALAAAAVVFAIWQVNKELDKTREKTKNVSESAKSWAEILGFSYLEMGQGLNDQGEVVETLDSKLQKLRETNKDVSDELSSFSGASMDDKWSRAIEEGLKVSMAGGSAEAAAESTRIALAIMGERFSDAEFTYKLKGEIDFDDRDAVVKRQFETFGKTLESAGNAEFDSGNWEKAYRAMAFGTTAVSDLNAKTKQKVQDSAREMWRIFESASEEERDRVFVEMERVGSDQADQVFSEMQAKYSDQFRDLGINNTNDLASYFTNKAKSGQLLAAGIEMEDVNRIGQEMKVLIELVRELARMSGLSDKEVEEMFNFSQLEERLQVDVKNAKKSIEELEALYKEAIKPRYVAGPIAPGTARPVIELSEAEKLAELNAIRMANGMSKATSSSEGFKDAAQDATDAVEEQNAAMEMITGTAEEFSDARNQIFSGTMDSAFSFANDIMSSQQETELDAIQADGDRRLASLEAQSDAQEADFERRADLLDSQNETRVKAFENRWESAMKSHDSRWKNRIKQEEDLYDGRIEKIEQSIEAEEKAEEQRQDIFEEEKRRLEQLASMFNMNIDFNVALNSGNIDEAAKIANDMRAEEASYYSDGSSDSSEAGSDARVNAMQASIDALEEEKTKRLEALELMETAEKEALEAKKEREKEALDAEKERYADALDAEKKSYQRSLEAQKDKINRESEAKEAARRSQHEADRRALELELATLKAFVPRNEAELQAHMKKVQDAYGRYGVNLQANGNQWGKYVGNALSSNVNTAASEMRNKVAWAQIAADIAQKMSQGAFGMTLGEFQAWITTGQLPKDNFNGAVKPSAAGGIGQPIVQDGKITGYRQPGGGVLTAYHKGGEVQGRTGYPASASKYPSEVDARLQVGERVINKKSSQMYGALLDNINRNPDTAMDGMGGALGMAGIMVSGVAGMMRQAMQMQMMTAAAKMTPVQMMGSSGMGIPGQPGKYGGVALNGDQLSNAAKIIATGKTMGASQRDLIIAIMTAMQESTLRNLNYGDRDSVGLFQQRPSQGWGTVQQIMSPEYSSRKFFEKLLKIESRGSMSTWEAAQAVQRSAFPRAYARWEAMSRDVVSGTGFSASPGMPNVVGKWTRPVSGGRISSRFGYRTDPINGSRRLHDGIDVAAPIGTPIYAAGAGSVTKAGWNGGFGNYIELGHGGGIATGYAHLSKIGVAAGQNVTAGSRIGDMGSTGRSTGSHIHFRYRLNGKSIDPSGRIPGLRDGGFTLNTGLANLHPHEAVLTKPLTQKFEQGVNNFAEGGGNYEFHVTINGNVNSELDVDRAFNKAMQKYEKSRTSKLGTNRRVS